MTIFCRHPVVKLFNYIKVVLLLCFFETAKINQFYYQYNNVNLNTQYRCMLLLFFFNELKFNTQLQVAVYILITRGRTLLPEKCRCIYLLTPLYF